MVKYTYIFDFINKEQKMYLTALSFAIILIGALLAFMSAQKGSKSGLVRSAINLASIVISAVLATFFSDWMSDILEGPSLSLIYGLGLEGAFGSDIGNINEVLSMIAEPVAAMLIYIPVFFVFYGIASLVCHFVYKEYCGNGEDNRVEYISEDAPFYVRESASLGMACGIVSGILLTIIIMSPLAGGLKTAKRVFKVIDNMAGESVITGSETYNLRRYSDDVMISVVYSTGGRALFDMTTMIKGNDGRVFMNDELDYLSEVDFADVESSIIGAVGGDAAATKKMNDHAEKSAIIDKLSFVCFKSACDQWRMDMPYCGIESPLRSCNTLFSDTIRQLLERCYWSSDKIFFANYQTMINVVGIIHDAQEMVGNSNDYETVLNLLTKGNTLKKIDEELLKNSNMYVQTDHLEKSVVSIVSRYLSDFFAEDMSKRMEFYGKMAEIFNDTRTGSEADRIAGICQGFDELFEENGVSLPSAATEKLVKTMINDFKYNGWIYQSDIDSLIIRYMYEYNYYMGDIYYK